jgi:hypothetical protein
MDIKAEVAKRMADQPLYSQERSDDPLVHAKLFNAFGAGTWYLTEYDGEHIAFGYVTGLAFDEWGYVSLDELEALCLPSGTPRIECDLWFEAVRFSQLRAQGLV